MCLNLRRGFASRFVGLFLLTASLSICGETRAEDLSLPTRGVVQANGYKTAREPIQLVSFTHRSSCGCRGCCAKHSWAPYYCGLESYHRPYYGEPGWRGFWKAEKCGIGRKHDMSCYNCPQGGSW